MMGAMIDHGEALLAKIRHIRLQRNVRQGSTELKRVVKEAVQAVWSDLHLHDDDWKAGNEGLLGRGYVSWHEQGARASDVLTCVAANGTGRTKGRESTAQGEMDAQRRRRHDSAFA